MKILFTIRSLTGGGAERVVSVLSGLLADVGEDVHIITYKTSERDYSISEKVQIHEMPQRKDSTITKGMRIFDMRKIIKEIQPDVIIPFVGTVLYVSWLAITGMKIPFVLTIRNNPWTMPEKRLLRNFRDYLAKKSCAILVQNEEQSEYFSADLRKKCFVVPNPLSSKFIDNHKEIYSRKISKIIAVGRLHEQKNYPLLLKAMVDITKIKSEITLDIFGEGNQKKYLEGLVDEYGLANHVFLRGRSQSIEKQLQVADMFVMTSDYEGMPNALMEAMAFGVPCISSDCKTGPRSLIKSFENGLLFQTNNVEDFDSVIVHKAPSNKGADVVSADETRIERFFYQARNGMYIARKNGKVGRRLRVIGGRIKNILRKAPDHKAKRVWVTCKGTISGFFFNPKIEYAHRKGE